MLHSKMKDLEEQNAELRKHVTGIEESLGGGGSVPRLQVYQIEAQHHLKEATAIKTIQHAIALLRRHAGGSALPS